MAHPQIVDGGDGSHIWSVCANILRVASSQERVLLCTVDCAGQTPSYPKENNWHITKLSWFIWPGQVFMNTVVNVCVLEWRRI
jgi:hypothetical protein